MESEVWKQDVLILRVAFEAVIKFRQKLLISFGIELANISQLVLVDALVPSASFQPCVFRSPQFLALAATAVGWEALGLCELHLYVLLEPQGILVQN